MMYLTKKIYPNLVYWRLRTDEEVSYASNTINGLIDSFLENGWCGFGVEVQDEIFYPLGEIEKEDVINTINELYPELML